MDVSTSWLNKGLDWALSDEVTMLQKRIKSMVDKDTRLASVIQVMLFRRILPANRTQHKKGVRVGRSPDPAVILWNEA